MRKMITTLVAASLLATAAPAFALFTNGGFEDGTFNGWDLTYGNVASSSTSSPAWTGPYDYYGYSPHPAAQIVSASTVNPGQTLDVNPYNGSYMAMINDINGYYHATRISQAATIAAEDLGDTLYVNWGAMLVDPSHPADAQPYFSINVLKNSVVVDSFSANASDASASGSGWVVAGSDGGSPLYYKAGQYTYDLSSFAAEDSISIEMFVADCGYGGHGGYAFLDGIGTDYVAPPGTEPVPEPSTMLLLGGGLAGLAFWRRKLRK